jgi:hypothetical protein
LVHVSDGAEQSVLCCRGLLWGRSLAPYLLRMDSLHELIAYRLLVVNGVVVNSALARILRRMGSAAGTCVWRSR